MRRDARLGVGSVGQARRWRTGAGAVGICELKWSWGLQVPDVFKFTRKLQKGFFQAVRWQIAMFLYKISIDTSSGRDARGSGLQTWHLNNCLFGPVLIKRTPELSWIFCSCLSPLHILWGLFLWLDFTYYPQGGQCHINNSAPGTSTTIPALLLPPVRRAQVPGAVPPAPALRIFQLLPLLGFQCSPL